MTDCLRAIWAIKYLFFFNIKKHYHVIDQIYKKRSKTQFLFLIVFGNVYLDMLFVFHAEMSI